jgi:16S rRNA (cytosine967-C5)-methyltransferase
MTTQGMTSRKIAHVLLMKVFKQKQTLEQAMNSEAKALNALSVPDRGFVFHLAMSVLRHRGACDVLLAKYLQQPIKDSRLDITLCLYLGICQLLVLKSPAHAAVDTSVELAKSCHPALSGLVNAVLKKIAREGTFEGLLPSANTPEWMWEEWVEVYGEATAQAIATAHLGEPPLDITVKDSTQIAHWKEALGAELLPTGSLRLRDAHDVTTLAGFDEGAWWVQELAASLPVKMMGDLRGKKVLDLCAAPGGKTMQLIAAGAEVTAVDISAKRLERLQENLTRMGMKADLIAADIHKWQPADLREPMRSISGFTEQGEAAKTVGFGEDSPTNNKFDMILLDAPCSATGTMRRHPEIMVLRTLQDKARLVQIQHQMLCNALSWLSPEGVLIYAVCSLQQEEGEDQINALLAEGNAKLIPLTEQDVVGMSEWLTPQGMLRTLPSHLADQGGMDGFFLARIAKIQ